MRQEYLSTRSCMQNLVRFNSVNLRVCFMLWKSECWVGIAWNGWEAQSSGQVLPAQKSQFIFNMPNVCLMMVSRLGPFVAADTDYSAIFRQYLIWISYCGSISKKLLGIDDACTFNCGHDGLISLPLYSAWECLSILSSLHYCLYPWHMT